MKPYKHLTDTKTSLSRWALQTKVLGAIKLRTRDSNYSSKLCIFGVLLKTAPWNKKAMNIRFVTAFFA